MLWQYLHAAIFYKNLKNTIMSTVKKLVIGMAVGAALGVLFAPAKGSKTRRRLARKGRHIKESWNDFKDNITGAIENIRDEIDDLADKVATEGNNIAEQPEAQPQWRTT